MQKIFQITRCNSEETSLRVDAAENTILVKLHPSDVVADTLDLVAGEGGLHHGQVGLAALARESSGDVMLLPVRPSDASDLRIKKSKAVFFFSFFFLVTQNLSRRSQLVY